jgi:catechol 2,3-dioxygenase-like lactoylglutathione lyase family enzyme
LPKVGASERWIGYGLRADAAHPDRTYIALYRGVRPDGAQGRHWCFKAENRAAVDAFWRAGLAHGGVDDGPPGLRPQYHPDYYGAFLRDPDGNRVEAVCHRAEG